MRWLHLHAIIMGEDLAGFALVIALFMHVGCSSAILESTSAPEPEEQSYMRHAIFPRITPPFNGVADNRSMALLPCPTLQLQRQPCGL
jgi:hypothetical protein